MLEHHELTALDPNNPYVPFNTGCYSLNLEIPGGGTRRMITYIPEGTQPSAAGVFLLPPSGVSAEEFLEKSNWKDIADGEETKEKLVEVLTSDFSNYQKGDSVTVIANTSVGFTASLYGYLLPLAVMVVTLIAILSLTKSEGAAALSALGILIPYYLLVYLFRSKLKKRLSFEIQS